MVPKVHSASAIAAPAATGSLDVYLKFNIIVRLIYDTQINPAILFAGASDGFPCMWPTLAGAFRRRVTVSLGCSAVRLAVESKEHKGPLQNMNIFPIFSFDCSWDWDTPRLVTYVNATIVHITNMIKYRYTGIQLYLQYLYLKC